MRLWEFDRSRGLASAPFNVNEDGLQLVKTVVGFLFMSEEGLGFDPTIITSGNERSIRCKSRTKQEQDASCLMGESCECGACPVGRQLVGRPMRKTIQAYRSWSKIRGRMSTETTTRVSFYKRPPRRVWPMWHDNITMRSSSSTMPPMTSGTMFGKDSSFRKPQSHHRAAKSPVHREEEAQADHSEWKAQADHARVEAPPSLLESSERLAAVDTTISPPSKRRLAGSTGRRLFDLQPNREHRRIILASHGKPIFKASSPAVLLEALNGCIKGHKSLYEAAGILHRDISIHNLLINDEADGELLDAFVIDLDHAIEILAGQRRPESSGKAAGTRVTMAIGALEGEQHSYMHDLESFLGAFLDLHSLRWAERKLSRKCQI